MVNALLFYYQQIEHQKLLNSLPRPKLKRNSRSVDYGRMPHDFSSRQSKTQVAIIGYGAGLRVSEIVTLNGETFYSQSINTY
jgi:site-specific recombinase XerC